MFYRVTIIAIFLSIKAIAQVNCSISIDLGEGFNRLFTPHINTFFISIEGKGKYCKINIYDCKGKMDVEIYRQDSTLESRGSFINSLDTLKEYLLLESFSDSTIDRKIVVNKYFKPLKNGAWKYYNKKGELIKEEEYKDGILIAIINKK